MKYCEDWCEDWIEIKLKQRLEEYKARYPTFEIDRVMEEIKRWPEKKQRWSPYMADKDIQRINERRRKRESFARFAKSQS